MGKKLTIMKIKKTYLMTILTVVGLILSGCTVQVKTNSSKGNSKTPTTAVKHNKPSVKKTSGSKKSVMLWDSSKDEKLKGFVDQWAPTMKQSYVKYDGSHSLKTSVGTTYPDYLSKVLVSGSKTSIGFSKDGNGNYTYNVVAIYNYNGTVPPLPNHITYFFAFYKGQPIVLVDQSRDGTANLVETGNTKLKDGFTAIANNEKVATPDSSTDTKTANSDTTVSDPKMIGVMVRQISSPGIDVTKDVDLSVYTANGRYWIGTGTSASNNGYTISGNSVNYWTRQTDSDGDTQEVEHTISLSDLEAKCYSTNDQKQIVQDVAGKMPAIEDMSDD